MNNLRNHCRIFQVADPFRESYLYFLYCLNMSLDKVWRPLIFYFESNISIRYPIIFLWWLINSTSKSFYESHQTFVLKETSKWKQTFRIQIFNSTEPVMLFSRIQEKILYKGLFPLRNLRRDFVKAMKSLSFRITFSMLSW